MPIVLDHNLARELNHSHFVENSDLFLLKAGDTATGTIVLPVTESQGNALIESINAGSIFIDPARIQLWRRFHMMLGG